MQADEEETRFVPLRPASRKQRAAAIAVGPLLWVIALDLVALLTRETDLIGTALLISGASFAFSFAVLLVLSAARRREERRYAQRR